MDEHLLQLQSGPDYAVALMGYLIASSEDPKAFVDATWKHGGDQSAGRVHALFLDNGGNHDPTGQVAQRGQHFAQKAE
jgi:hypothetical protein